MVAGLSSGWMWAQRWIRNGRSDVQGIDNGLMDAGWMDEGCTRPDKNEMVFRHSAENHSSNRVGVASMSPTCFFLQQRATDDTRQAKLPLSAVQ